MTNYNKATLATFFQTGDVPQGTDYTNLINSQVNLVETAEQDMAGPLYTTKLISPRVSASSIRAAGEVDLNGNAFIGSGGSLTVNGTLDVFDSKFNILNSSDQSKQAIFNLSSISPSTQRIYALPDTSGTFVLTKSSTDLTLDVSGNVNLNADENFTVSAQGSLTLNTAANYFVSAQNISNFNTGGSQNYNSGGGFTFNCDGGFLVSAQASFTVNAGNSFIVSSQNQVVLNAGGLCTINALGLKLNAPTTVSGGLLRNQAIVSAAGTAQGTATLIPVSAGIARLQGTADGTATGYLLPAPTGNIGTEQIVVHEGAVSGNLWPNVGCKINGLSTNIPFPLVANTPYYVIYTQVSGYAVK